MNTLTKVVVGGVVVVGGIAAWRYWSQNPRPKVLSGLTHNCGPLAIEMGDEASTPRFQRMMVMYTAFERGEPLTVKEIDLLKEYFAQLCPETELEKASLGAVRNKLDSVTGVSGSVHVAGCGCTSCAAKTGESCCDACAHGMPCTGACARKSQPQTVGRA